MKKVLAGFMFGWLALAGFAQSGACAEVLITADESKLPPSVNVGITTRGLTRGPGIEQISPSPTLGVASPLPLKIKFDIRNKVEIDPDSVKLTYLKANPVDITDRIKKHVTGTGIEMDQAEVPPGTHVLRLDIKDKEGRTGTAMIKLVVSGQ
jgi:hypothetical protein